MSKKETFNVKGVKKASTNKVAKTNTAKDKEKTKKKEVEIIKFEPLAESKKIPPKKQAETLKKTTSKVKKDKKEVPQEEATKEMLESEEKPREKKVTSNLFTFNAETNDKIQTFISILFTIVIFIALFILIAVLYNNYLKPKDDINKEEVCKDFLPKDYHITTEMIGNFIKNARPVIYNFDNFKNEKLSNEEIMKFATYFIWGANEDYIVCEDSDEKCLVSKMEMPYDTLKEYFNNYLDITDLKLNLTEDYQDDDEIRLYQEDDKIVLTFSEFQYQSYKHDLVYEHVDEDKVTLIFALENLVPNSNIYEYIGAKRVELKYKNKNLIIESIETSLKNK